MTEVIMDAPGRGEVRLMLAGFDEPVARRAAARPANSLGMWRSALLLPELDNAVDALRTAGIELVSAPQSMAMGGLPELGSSAARLDHG
jgi:hypothetical protein